MEESSTASGISIPRQKSFPGFNLVRASGRRKNSSIDSSVED